MIPLLLFGPVMFVGVANGLSLPSAIASAISLRPELAGTASGLVGFLQMMVGALATLLVGHLQDDTALPMALLITPASIIPFLGSCRSRTAPPAPPPAPPPPPE